uniref:Elongation of very long chain fatty acids protein n=1 Tax=Strigamia maritima TaxID=126957 RepID=T1J202_STRMM
MTIPTATDGCKLQEISSRAQFSIFNVESQSLFNIRPTTMNDSHLFVFEKNFDIHPVLQWYQTYWKVTFLYVAIYLLLIYLGQRWMQKRHAFELRAALVVWNWSLALFSIFGVYRIFPEIIYEWQTYGFEYTVCDNTQVLVNPILQFWGWFFGLSKVVELGDTAFIVLRKRKLVFLHWYHHVTVLVYTWYSGQQIAPTNQWFVLMNLMVHSAMYSYFALTAMKFKIPRFVAMMITTAQLLQMIGGLYVNWRTYGAIVGGRHCDTAMRNIQISMMMYASYWLLFAVLFYDKSQRDKKVNEMKKMMNQSFVFSFEKNFDTNAAVQWFRNYWTLSILYVVIYLLLVHLGQRWMRSRRAFHLRPILSTWNWSLAVFSVLGTSRISPEILDELRTFGFEYTVCDTTRARNNPILAFWSWYFIMSKVVELGDTAFIILRKQKLVFLHWYHHVTVLVYSWFSASQVIPTARWFILMNFTVHAVMYTYFALKAVQFNIPRSVAMTITVAQLFQMFGGLYANWRAYGVIVRGQRCETDFWNIRISLLMYASYCCLFAHFFYDSYLKKRLRQKTAWNWSLAMFSILGTCRLLPQLVDEWWNFGFEYTICDSSRIKYNGVLQFWIWYFAMSKVFELGDTAFIVLRKQRLLFLHWYHHVTVLLYTWYSISQVIASGRWFVIMNYAVHAVMYSYYAFKAMKFKVPRSVAMTITTAQLLQMVGGLYVNLRAYSAISGGRSCDSVMWNILMSLMMYASYGFCSLFCFTIQNFDIVDKINWLKAYWQISIFFAVIYVILIFFGQRYMQSRTAFDLRKPLVVWNLSLALFSIVGTCRFIPEAVHVWSKFGFQFTVCNGSFYQDNPVTALWAWLFLMSKVLEFGDTAFIVLRKQKLVFLHWYHHVTVLIYAWYTAHQLIATSRWFILMNFMVHSAMYLYFALRALKFSVPRQIAMIITSAQLLQMVVGLYVNWWTYGALMRGEYCGTNFDNINVSLLMYFSYFLLFVNLFYTKQEREPTAAMTKSFIFAFEENFDYEGTVLWIRTYWTLSFVYVSIYLLLISLGQHWMKSRRAFELRALLAIWNWSLALFSIMGTWRILPQLWNEVEEHGFEHTVCNKTFFKENLIFSFWCWYFVLSKVVELGDTAFIVLRKQPLAFLHWYHHVTVLLYTWYSTQQLVPTSRWFILMNFTVHSAMYSYYALKAIEMKIPRPVAMTITTAQLFQMIGGLYVNWRAYGAISGGRYCDTGMWNIQMSILMYASYWLLFAHFFYGMRSCSNKSRPQVIFLSFAMINWPRICIYRDRIIIWRIQKIKKKYKNFFFGNSIEIT